MIVAGIVGATLVIVVSTFVVLNPILFGMDTGVDLENIFVFDKHFMLDNELMLVQDKIGDDFEAYRNHCLRVMTFTQYFMPESVYEAYPNAMNIVAMAIAFHDVALWTDGTLDYLGPSAAQMEFLVQKEGIWEQEQVTIAQQIILWHHKVTDYTGGATDAINDMVNAVRKADWADFTMGILRSDMPAPLIEAAFHKVPEAGFHKRLMAMGPRLSPNSILGQLAVLKIFKW